jgi:predicted nucleic-acid-binding Zn-ribbon protein
MIGRVHVLDITCKRLLVVSCAGCKYSTEYAYINTIPSYARDTPSQRGNKVVKRF